MDKNRRYFELFGVASVVASLLFVGVQINQTTEATRSETVLQLKDSWVQLNLAYATSVELAAAEEEVQSKEWDDVSFQSRVLFAGATRALFHMWSNAYFQFQNGTMDEGQWTPVLQEITETMQHASNQQVWSDWGYLYEAEFRAVVEQEIPNNK